MDIQEAAARQVQHRLRDDPAVIGEDAEVGLQVTHRRDRDVIPDGLGLQEPEAAGTGGHRDRGPGQGRPPPGRPIGHRDDADEIDLGHLEQGFEDRHGERSRAEEGRSRSARRRGVGRRRPGHARAGVRTRDPWASGAASSSSSSIGVTEIKSSIDSR